MLTMLKNWEGAVEINNTRYPNINQATINFKPCEGVINIKLYPKHETGLKTPNMTVKTENKEERRNEVEITVKKYMTEPSSPGFDFMAKWNNDKPMPCRIMAGTKVKETKGMVYMKLHALAKSTITCTCCGKELTNPVSRYYGIGPICLSKMGIARDINEVDAIKEDLENVTWEGWIIKSAIKEEEEI